MSEEDAAKIYDTPERLDAGLEKATQKIVEDFQRGNKCHDLQPYSRTTTIDERGGSDDAMASYIELIEEYSRDMTEPKARVRAVVSVRWPVHGIQKDKWDYPTNFVASFPALAAMYDNGRAIKKATYKAKRWADSTVTLIDQARYQHAMALGLDIDESEAV